MIPFARMLEYGNEVIPREEFDMSIQAQYNAVFYMHRNGDLYSYGSNNLGQLGVGDSTTRSTWTKVLTSVKKYWLGVHGCLAIKDDDTIWYTGSKTAFPQLPVGVTVFTDVTSYFTAIGMEAALIKNVMITDSIKIHTTDGRFLYCGSNGSRQLGTGTSAAVSTLTFHSTMTNVASMNGNFNSTLLVLTSGEAWQAGAYPSGTSTAVRASFEKILDSVRMCAGSYDSNYYFMQDGTVRVSGFNSAGQCSVGNSSIVLETGLSNFSYDPSDTMKTYSSLTNSAGTSPIVMKNGVLYRCGSNSSGQIGTGSTTPSTITTMTSPLMTNVSSIKYFCGDTIRYYIIDNDYKLYTCGSINLNGVPNYDKFTYAGAMPWN